MPDRTYRFSGLELVDAAPAQLRAERDQPNREDDPKNPLGSDGGEVSPGKSAENAADDELREDGQIVIARV